MQKQKAENHKSQLLQLATWSSYIVLQQQSFRCVTTSLYVMYISVHIELYLLLQYVYTGIYYCLTTECTYILSEKFFERL